MADFKINPQFFTYSMPKKSTVSSDFGGVCSSPVLRTSLLFSIMIPVYNAEKVVRRTLDSVLRQSCPDFELLLCDDKSTDGSLKILKEYAARDSRIKLSCNEKNCGSLITRNRMIKAAKGDYLMWMDNDDEIAPDFLAHAAVILEKEAYDILEYPALFFHPAPPHHILTKENRIEKGGNLAEFFLSDWRALRWNLWSKVIKAKVMKNSMPPDFRYCTDDIFFALPIFYNACSYRFIADIHPMYKWYVGNGTWSGAIYRMTPEKFEKRCRMRRDSIKYNVDFIRSHRLPEKLITPFVTGMCDLYDLPQIIGNAPEAERIEYLRRFFKYFASGNELINGYPLAIPAEFLLKYIREIPLCGDEAIKICR